MFARSLGNQADDGQRRATVHRDDGLIFQHNSKQDPIIWKLQIFRTYYLG